MFALGASSTTVSSLASTWAAMLPSRQLQTASQEAVSPSGARQCSAVRATSAHMHTSQPHYGDGSEAGHAVSLTGRLSQEPNPKIGRKAKGSG